jgi:predicted dehydrogenase
LEKKFHVGFLGAGGIARSHVYALDALKFYYQDSPTIQKVLVASPTPQSRESFAQRFGFTEVVHPDQFWENNAVDTLFILSPNQTHTQQLLKAAQMPHIQRIYVEKPLGISHQDIHDLEELSEQKHGKIILTGFQFLQKSAIRRALADWHSGVFGTPVHFRAEYHHSSYLDRAYRLKHPDRLVTIPVNGAIADMGSHILSLLTAFLGNTLVVKFAKSSGHFPEVPKNSDLCTTVLLEDSTSGAIGTLVASRITPGSGDLLTFQIHGTRGSIQYTTDNPDCYETYLPDLGWQRHEIMSDYGSTSKFPSHYVPSGWLRALIHTHYLFLGGEPGHSIVPDLKHGILVQRLIQQIADFILES